MKRRSLWRWVGVSAGVLGVLAIAALATGAGYEAITRDRVRQAFPTPGRLVDVGEGRKIQIDCRGSGAPTIVLIHGFDGSGAQAFSRVHDALGQISRTCATSRAGIMWSDPDPRPFTAEQQAADLRAALAASGETPPYVLVPHSLGGPYATVFTRLFPNDVAGYVFIDTSHPDQEARFEQGAGEAYLKSNQAQKQQLDLGSALAWSGLTRRIVLMQSNQRPSWRPEHDAAAGDAFLPTTIATLSKEWAAISATLASGGRIRELGVTPLGHRPLIVLTAGDGLAPEQAHAMGLTPDRAQKMTETMRSLGADQARWSACGEQRIVEHSGHYIQYMRPDAVIAAVSDVVAAVRNAPGDSRAACAHA